MLSARQPDHCNDDGDVEPEVGDVRRRRHRRMGLILGPRRIDHVAGGLAEHRDTETDRRPAAGRPEERVPEAGQRRQQDRRLTVTMYAGLSTAAPRSIGNPSRTTRLTTSNAVIVFPTGMRSASRDDAVAPEPRPAGRERWLGPGLGPGNRYATRFKVVGTKQRRPYPRKLLIRGRSTLAGHGSGAVRPRGAPLGAGFAPPDELVGVQRRPRPPPPARL